MKLRHLFLALALSVLFAYAAQAVDKTVEWDPVVSDNLSGYRIYTAPITAETLANPVWTQQAEADANTTSATITLPDTGLTLIKASAYNNIGEAINTVSGVFYDSDWQISPAPMGLRTPGE